MPQLVDVPGHGVVEFPDGMSDDQIASAIKANMQPQAAPHDTGIMGDLKNAAGGFARSGMGVVSNLMRPLDAMGITGSSNDERMARVNQRFGNQGYDQDSLSFKGGKLVGDVAVTAPVGGALAKGVTAAGKAIPAVAPYAAKLAQALQTGGFKLGGAPATTAAGRVADALTRVGSGAAVGGASAGMINPDEAGTGAVLGGVMPVAVKAAGDAGTLISDKLIKPAASRLMQSAIKPTIKQLKNGDAQVAIETLLKYGINPTSGGVEKLRGMVDDLNSQISDKIAGSNASIKKTDVLDYLADTAKRFGNQVSPTSDLNAIAGVADDFFNHPGVPGDTIPVQVAQALKQGTYKALAGKYGEVGSAATEAQKALARGLKDKVGEAVPGIAPLNAEEARLIKTLGVTERRALMELNKNPVGLSALASNPVGFAAFMADRSAAFKSIAARMINRSAAAPASIGMLSNKLENPLLRSLPVAISAGRTAPQ